MSDVLLSPDGVPVYTEAEKNAIPGCPESSGNTPDTLDRLCEYDEGAQTGCRRTQTILALEAQYDTFVSPEMVWGVFDEFCIHDGHYIYEKDWLDWNESEDTSNISADSDADLIAAIATVRELAGDNFAVSAISYKDLLTAMPAGLPPKVDDTDDFARAGVGFFRLESVGDVEATLDDITRENLDIIKNSFTDDMNPLLSNLGLGGLYFKDGSAYYAKVTECWDNNPNAKLGVFMDTGKSSETYADAETTAFFFPFSPLTDEQLAVVNALYVIEKRDSTTSLEIVNL